MRLLFVFLLLGTGAIFAENRPEIRLVNLVHDARYITPGTVTLRAEVINGDTRGGRVEFYEQIVTTNFLLGAVTNPPYFLTLTNVQPGFHSFGAAYIDYTGVPVSVTHFPLTLHLETRAGASDTSFTHQYFNPSRTVRTIVPLEDGSILVGGFFQRYGAFYIPGLIKLAFNGDQDPDFAPIKSGAIWDVVKMPNGKILFGGDFEAASKIARLNRDCTRDTLFNPGVGGQMDRFFVQRDGSVLIAGRLFSRHFSGARPIAKINPDDSLDLDFCSGTVVDEFTRVIAVQPNGKIWIGGSFSTVNGQPMRGLACLRQDGSIAPEVMPLKLDGGFAHVYALAVQADGKLLVGGNFSSVNGIERSGIFRLNADGSLDEEFGPGPGVDGSVWCFALQSDGKIYVGGQFSTYNGVGCTSYIRLDDNGRVDKSFALPPQRKGRFINGMALDEKRKRLYIGGEFSSIMTELCVNLACLRTQDGEPLFSVKPQPSEDGQFAISVNTFAEETFHLEAKSIGSEKSEWEPVSSWIGNGLRVSVTDTNAPASGRIYRVRMERREQ